MWGKLAGNLSNIVCCILLFFLLFDRTSRKRWGIGLIVSGALSIYLNLYPVENLFYSFSTPEAVAQYACEGEILRIIDGEESSLIVYISGSEENELPNYMLSERTSAGYKIGSQWGEKKYRIPTGRYALEIIESSGSADRYIYMFGAQKGTNIVVSDTLNSQFVVSSYGVDKYTAFGACALLDHMKNNVYEITVSSTQETEKISLLEENGTLVLKEE